MQLNDSHKEDISECEPILRRSDSEHRFRESSSSCEIVTVGGDHGVIDEVHVDESCQLVNADQPLCRIYLDSGGEDLIAPCHCKGTPEGPCIHLHYCSTGIDEEKSVSFGSSFECPNISSTTTTSPPTQDGESSPFQGFVKVDSGPTSSSLFGGPPKDSLSFGSRELSPNSSPFGPSPFEGDAKIGWDPSFSSPSPFGGPSFGSRELAPSSSPFGRSPFQGDAKIDNDPTSFSLFGGSLKDNFTFGSRELSPNSSPFGPSPFQGDAKINCDPTFPSPFGSSLKNSFSFGSSQSFPNFSQFSPSPFQGDTKIHRGCTSSSIFGLTPKDSFTFGSRELSPNYSLFSSTTLQKDTKFKCGTTSSPVFGCRPRDGSTRKFSKFSPFSPNPFHRENKFISGCFCPKTSFTNLQHDPAAFHFCPQNLKCFSNIPSPPTPIFHQPPQLAEKRFDVGEKCCLCGPKWPRQGKAYAATPAPDSESLQSISAMPFFQHKSHEELRFEDHQFQVIVQSLRVLVRELLQQKKDS